MAKQRIINPAVMILVHPGSLCGSANFNLGREAAINARRDVACSLYGWTGNFLVLDGELSRELALFPFLDETIKKTLTQARKNGFGKRLRADPPDHMQIGLDFLREKFVDLDTKIFITGAWADKETGCVTGMYETLVDAGYINVEVLANAPSCDELDDEDDALRENTRR